MSRNVLVRSLVAAAVGALVAVGAAQAQAAAAAPAPVVRVAVIDVQRILTDSGPGKETLAKLKQLQDGKIAEAKTKQDEIQALRTRINDGRLSLAEDKIADLEKQVEDKMIAFRRFQDDADRDLQKARDDAFDAIEKRVLPIIGQIGKENGYTLVFNKYQSGLVYADDKIDITDQVIQRFDAANKAK
ncbi:MAG: OmpH family outer membrane protein [Acidobacteriota bacterium]